MPKKKEFAIKFDTNKNTVGVGSTQREINRFGCNIAIEPQYSFASLIDIYETNGTARKCIELYAKNVVSSGWDILPIKPESINLEESLEVKNFFENCSSEHTFEYIIKEMIIDLKSTGNAGLELARNPITKKPDKLFNIPIDTLRIAQGGGDKGFLTGQRFVHNSQFSYTGAGELTWFNKYNSDINERTKENGYSNNLNKGKSVTNEILFFKEPNPKSIHYGQSSSVTLLRNYLLTKYAEEYNVNEFENGLLSKFMITVKNGNMSPQSVKAIQEYMSQIRRTGKANTIPVLNVTGSNAAIQIDKLGVEQKEGSYIQLLKYNREEVYIAFGVPPILLGIVDRSSLANQRSQERKFFEKEIMPLQQELAYRFTKMIKNDFGLKGWYFKFKTPDLRDIQRESDIAALSVKDGSMSINEKREVLGLEALLDKKGNRIKGADAHIVNTSQGLLSVEDLDKIGSPEFATQVGNSTAKIITNNLLNMRKAIEVDSNIQRIKDGTDDEDDCMDKYSEIDEDNEDAN